MRVWAILAVWAAGSLVASGSAWAQSNPARGTLVSAEAGDVACYLRIRDEDGQTRNWMAAFELCEGAEARIGQRFALTWRAGNVLHPSCQGNMDCGRSLRVMLIEELRPLPR
jgi:hypothetical protein